MSKLLDREKLIRAEKLIFRSSTIKAPEYPIKIIIVKDIDYVLPVSGTLKCDSFLFICESFVNRGRESEFYRLRFVKDLPSGSAIVIRNKKIYIINEEEKKVNFFYKPLISGGEDIIFEDFNYTIENKQERLLATQTESDVASIGGDTTTDYEDETSSLGESFESQSVSEGE